MSSDTLLKFSHPDGCPILREDRFHVEPANGQRARFMVTTGASPIRMIRDIVRNWSPPFVILYVLIVTRSEMEPARYQSPWLDDIQSVDAFLVRFGNFFEQDARHALWIFASDEGLQIVYDRHELISVYGDNERVGALLEERGFVVGEANIPVPHAHHYHAQFDEDFAALMGWWQWVPSPLQPSDEA